ncbi:hypothetical protein ACWF94_00425 [Streptomyces sp. NPDC055078]
MTQAALTFTKDRRRCTGESHQALYPLLKDGQRPLGIPAADQPEQALLETAVFLACCKLGGFCEHPLGIAQVRPGPDQLFLRLVNEPYVIKYWAEFLLPRPSQDTFVGPQDQVIGVPGLRYRHERGGICLYRPGQPADIVLTGFNPQWWTRTAKRMARDYGPLLVATADWTSVERAAYEVAAASPCDPPSIYSPLLRRIRATAGAGPINGTDAWHAVNGNVRLETTDGPPCPDLIHLFGDGPTGLGWQVDHKQCTCLCDHIHTGTGCNVDFRDPVSGRSVHYSNGKWGRTLDDQRSRRVREMNRTAFT